MEQSPTLKESNHSYSQEIPRLLYNPKVYYSVHKSPLLVPIISQMHTVHIFPIYFPKIHSNIIFPSTHRSSKWSLSFTSSNQNICISHLVRVTCPTHPIPDLVRRINTIDAGTVCSLFTLDRFNVGSVKVKLKRSTS